MALFRGVWVWLVGVGLVFTGVVAGPSLAADVAPGTPDAAFNTAVGTTLNDEVYAMAVQPDSKVVVGGKFTSPSNYLARFNADGTPDTAFNNATAVSAVLDDRVFATALQSDGKVLVGGRFTSPSGHLARFNADGTPDTAFNTTVGDALTQDVLAVAVQPDGKIVIGGGKYSPQSGFLKRFNADGTPDTAFNAVAGSSLDHQVFTVAVQPDGKIVAGGPFSAPSKSLARFNTDGTEDTAFNTAIGTVFNDWVRSVAAQPDGKIVVGGDFTAPSKQLARFNADGSEDTAFNAAVGDVLPYYVYALGLDENGKIVVGGEFFSPALFRFNADGTPDPAFSTAAGNVPFYVYGLGFAPDGKILVVGGQGAQGYLVRFYGDPAEAGLELSVEQPGQTDPGAQAVVRFMVKNSGPSEPGQVKVVTTLPDGVRFVSAAPPWQCVAVGQQVECTLVENRSRAVGVAGGSYPPLELTVVTAAPGTVGSYSFQGRVSSDLPNPTPDKATATATIPVTPVVYELSKTAGGPYRVGDQVEWALSVTSKGSFDDAGQITVTDTLPGGLEFVSGAGDGWACKAAGQKVTCEHAGLAKGQTSQAVITTRLVAVGSLTNEAKLSMVSFSAGSSVTSAADTVRVRRAGQTAAALPAVPFRIKSGRTDQGQKLTTRVRCRPYVAGAAGEVSFCEVTRKGDVVRVKVLGKRKVVVRVVQRAPGTKKYRPFVSAKKYIVKP